jgi:hypothetical protein
MRIRVSRDRGEVVECFRMVETDITFRIFDQNPDVDCRVDKCLRSSNYQITKGLIPFLVIKSHNMHFNILEVCDGETCDGT